MAKNHNFFLKNFIILWHFLNQPLFRCKTLFNPFKFWQLYHIHEDLERLWNYDTIQFLDKCCNFDTINLLERCLAIENEANQD
ncbi:hypothetical protein [Aulosira sp. FACHB-615]|uniref:hypothetical protein n=1 Tax=Aulosira sp. FACHB-615 TaxID=2692777 RepID=UPI0016896DE5|nr:hypothetical protein [Aulosira sp. FACHB-615]MBD2490809.1 hypothetical protein [Aulosira sp. FACHB-615]